MRKVDFPRMSFETSLNFSSSKIFGLSSKRIHAHLSMSSNHCSSFIIWIFQKIFRYFLFWRYTQRKQREPIASFHSRFRGLIFFLSSSQSEPSPKFSRSFLCWLYYIYCMRNVHRLPCYVFSRARVRVPSEDIYPEKIVRCTKKDQNITTCKNQLILTTPPPHV